MPLEVAVVDPLDALILGRSSSVLRVGLALPRSGVLGMTGPAAHEAVLVAADEVNRSSGGRKIEFVVVDSGQSTTQVAQEVGRLILAEAVDAFVGLHTSETMLALEGVVSQKVPYVFAAGFEANRKMRGIYVPGETPDRSAPFLEVLADVHGISRWAILGTDYVWPRAARRVQRLMIAASGGEVVYDRLLPLVGSAPYITSALDELTRGSAQGIVLNMPGRDLATVLLALKQRGLDRRLVRVSGGCLEEHVLLGIEGDRTGTLYASMNSFDTLQSEKRQALNERYRSAAGERAPVLDSWAEHCYDAIHLLTYCDERDLLNPRDFTALVDGDGAGRDTTVLPRYEQHLARAEGMSFSVL